MASRGSRGAGEQRKQRKIRIIFWLTPDS